MKKLLNIIITFIFVIVPINTLASSSSSNLTNDNLIVGYLTDDEGETIEVKGTLVNQEKKRNILDNSNTYLFELYRNRSSNTLTSSEKDSTLSIKVYMTISYTKNRDSSGSSNLYLLTKVSGYWNMLDSRVFVSGTPNLRVGCTDFKTSSQIKNYSVNNYFSINPRFTNAVLLTSGGEMGGTLSIKLAMNNSRTWTFSMSNQLSY